MEKDPYHPYSTYLMAYAGPRAIGMMRLVHDSPIGLPIEQFVDVSDLKQGRTVIECRAARGRRNRGLFLTLVLLVRRVAGHVDADGMDTSAAPADDILAFTSGACRQRRVPLR
ncbi:hypothetical protein [Sorangium sp. So ce1151]|uniref:hypothetical protein n=1 Tax=Sorangium sp. So ce1151 TaxID=3133332 RepID=UPI003F6469C1